MKWWLVIAAVLASVAMFLATPVAMDAMPGHDAHGMAADEMAGDPMCFLHCLTEATAIEKTLATFTPLVVAALVAVVAFTFAFPGVRPVLRPAWVPDPGRTRRILTTCKRE